MIASPRSNKENEFMTIEELNINEKPMYWSEKDYNEYIKIKDRADKLEDWLIPYLIFGAVYDFIEPTGKEIIYSVEHDYPDCILYRYTLENKKQIVKSWPSIAETRITISEAINHDYEQFLNNKEKEKII
jgi:hypothetical protein